MKAIDTLYAGYKFRSRLEARWAVFFNTLKIPFEYEVEGFDLGEGLFYLPDFWLPDQKCWIEIKGDEPNEEEEKKAKLLAEQSGFPVYIFFSDIYPYDEAGERKSEKDGGYAHFPDGGWDNNHLWCVCSYCDKYGIEFEGRSARLPCGCVKKNAAGYEDRACTADVPEIRDAFLIACQVRFEHNRPIEVTE